MGRLAAAWVSLILAAHLIANAAAAEPDEGLFRTSIPAGFEDLSAPQTSLVDVFFLGQHVDVAMATFAPGSFAFVDPEAVVARLPQIARPGTVTLALSGELEPNAALACGARARPGCGTLEPDDAAVIFDADRFRVDIFVSPELLAPQRVQQARFQPAPQAGFSGLETVSAAVAGSTSDATDFTLRSYSLFAHDTRRLTAETSVSSADNANLDAWPPRPIARAGAMLEACTACRCHRCSGSGVFWAGASEAPPTPGWTGSRSRAVRSSPSCRPGRRSRFSARVASSARKAIRPATRSWTRRLCPRAPTRSRSGSDRSTVRSAKRPVSSPRLPPCRPAVRPDTCWKRGWLATRALRPPTLPTTGRPCMAAPRID